MPLFFDGYFFFFFFLFFGLAFLKDNCKPYLENNVAIFD
jgi:hypothetical protein